MRTAIVIYTLMAAACSACAQTTELDSLVGRDLWTDRPSRAEQLRLDRVIGELPVNQAIGGMTGPGPWHVWKTSLCGAARYVVLAGEAETMIPGGSSACVLLFDGSLKNINRWCFATGWRITFNNASFRFSPELGTDAIILEMTRMPNGYNVAKEYFALSGDQLRLVRLEDGEGAVVQNEYILPNYTIGFVPEATTEAEWIEMLHSAERANKLAALVFLGGRHLREIEWRLLPGPQEGKYSPLFQQLMGSPRIRELITGLAHSEDQWIREAALLAARDPAERPRPQGPPVRFTRTPQ